LPGNTSFNDPNGLHDNIPGVYEITYVHNGITAISHVTLLPNVTLVAKDSTIYTGQNWNMADNFSGTVDGKPLDLTKGKISGTVDKNKVGVYPVTYTYEDQSKTVNVTVKQDQTSLKVKDLTYHVGDKINLR
ncbi:bacterial Ig-like domain-containing protein, partial [Lactococcus lactis]|uniref:bacterial Ig-like domain-containing protein n=1 Tax=Lactococcus lactis TaxID=1358 RepID=UPI002416BAC0